MSNKVLNLEETVAELIKNNVEPNVAFRKYSNQIDGLSEEIEQIKKV